jgi:predicted amidohydrolase YtcJ
MAHAGDEVQVVDIGDNVAYPGFIDAHAHWIGDRDYYDIGSPAEAMDEAIRHGWTTISEQWVDQERIAELEGLAGDRALPLRVDAYLALNALEVGGYYGDWYVDRQPEQGSVDDRLRVRGLKIHLDSGSGAVLYWDAATLTETIARANESGWQVSVHAVSTEAQEMVLDAFEAAIGATGPNPLHHRIEHALQVTDEQLDRMVAMDIVPVIQLDGVAGDWVQWAASLGDDGDEIGRDYEAEGVGWLGRWRDFVDAGLHVAATTDMPWFLIDFKLTDGIGRPQDQIAGGMDGRGRVYPDAPEWVLNQLLTADEGLRALTVDAAWALGDEERRGHLAPGTYGDVTILSRDVTSGSPDEIRSTNVIATIVGGKVAFCADPALCP